MKPLKANEIVGNWAALLLPIDEDERIDYGRLQAELEVLTASGVNGIYSNGTAGEFYAQSEREYETINGMLAEACEKRNIPFQIGACHMSPQLSLERIRKAVEWQPGAIQVILSDWFPLSDDEMIACLDRMAEVADPIGLILYNPPHAKRVLQPADYAKIRTAVPNVIGIKTAGGDAAWYEEMKQLMPDMSVFIPGHFLATGYAQGAHGAYSNMSSLHPSAAQRWYELMKTDLEAALELESRIHQFMFNYITPFITEKGYCNAACDKLLAAIGGWSEIGTRMRWPYRSIPEEEAERLRPIAKQWIPEFFE